MNYRKTWIREIGKEPKEDEILFKKSDIFVRPIGGKVELEERYEE